jgi:hypothetical protein
MQIANLFKSHKESVLFLIVILFSSLFYLFNINFSEIWIDETFTKALIRHPFSEMFKLLANDFHPPLYFLGLKIFTAVVGNNDFTIRLFSVIGVICTLILSYTVGQKVLGKNGALLFCVMIIALPMPAFYSHSARMYTWAAFATTGVFFYASLFIKTNKTGDLFFLGLFSLMAAYTHYYCLIAAFWADLFVLLYLLFIQNKSWRNVTIMGGAVFVLFLPWFFILLSQTHAAQKDFWIPAVSPSTLLSCYLNPFGSELELYYLSYMLAVLIYGLTILAIYRNYVSHKDENKIVLGLSLIVFHFTILTAVVLSLVLRPLLYHRYIMCVAPMIMVPPSLYIMNIGNKWIKTFFVGLFVCCGIYISLSMSSFSFGPYKQCLVVLQKNHPDVKKIVHVMEITAGPLYEYGKDGPWSQYCLKNEKAVWYTNTDVFDGMQSIKKLNDILKINEVFCAAEFPYVDINKDNLDLIISQCETMTIETVVDDKSKSGINIKLYILKYQGKKAKTQ